MGHPLTLVRSHLQAFSFLLGGYETTASSLGFTIYNLSANPDKAAKLTEVTVLGAALVLECMTALLSWHVVCMQGRAQPAPAHTETLL